MNDTVVSPCTHSASLLSNDAISDLYTTVVQYLTPYYKTDSQSYEYYTCTCNTESTTSTCTVYRPSDTKYVRPSNLCNLLDYMCYHNTLSSYDPVEHTYIPTYQFLTLSTNNAVFSADAARYYEMPTGYEYIVSNISLTSHYELHPSVNKRIINAKHDVTARIVTGNNTYASINYANDTVPLALGCSIIFSATQLPDKFLYIGVKGGNGGYAGYSIGKIILPSQIKSLGNNLYLFNDVIGENLPFMTQALCMSHFYNEQEVNAENSTRKILTSAFNFSTTIVTDSTLHYNATIANSEDTSITTNLNFSAINTRKLENFNAISTTQWLTCAKLNEDYALQIQPATAVITPRYDKCQTIQYVKNNTKYLVHSTEYSAFGVSTDTSAVLNWGDTSRITDMLGSFANSKVRSIPETWGNWSNLTGANSMFYRASELHNIPASWNGLSAVKDASIMFFATSVEHIPDSWEGLDSVEKLNNAFMKSTVSNIPTDLFEMCPNINNISAMFSQCYKLTATSADIETFIDKAIAHGLTTSQYKECFLQCSAIENYEELKNKYQDWF